MHLTSFACVIVLGMPCNAAWKPVAHSRLSPHGDMSADARIADIEPEPSLGSSSTSGQHRLAPLTLLPQEKGEESPACLDGSPYGIYFTPSRSGSTKWTVAIEGGGWCQDEQQCYARSKTPLGSSTGFPATAKCRCMNSDGSRGLDNDCNCIYMPYCDGASFTGYRAKPHAVPGAPAALLTFRGIKNLDASIDWALDHGLREATEFVLTGVSAGGLSTFLHADRVAARVREQARGCNTIVAAPIDGFFLDHDNFRHSLGQPNIHSSLSANFTSWMRYIYRMQNLTFGSDGGLAEACRKKNPGNPGLCFMAPHMQNTIQTPFFMFNSKFDLWQLEHELQASFSTEAERLGVLRYGNDFLRQFSFVRQNKRNGAFITSCVCHGCSWYSHGPLDVAGKSPMQAYTRWLAGIDAGGAAVTVDKRGPNGDGGINDALCAKWPQSPKSS